MATNEAKRSNNQSPVFANQLTTVEDLINFKRELITEIKQLISAHTSQPVKRWLKSFEVKELLHISTGLYIISEPMASCHLQKLAA